MNGETSTERMRRNRMNALNASITQMQDSSEGGDQLLMTEDGENASKLSQTVGLKSIRTEKFDPIFRSTRRSPYSQEASCFTNCWRMLCDRSQAPD